MDDRDVVINELVEHIESALAVDSDYVGVRTDLLQTVVGLLKKHGDEIEQLNRFVNGFSRDAMPVVRCKDCKHRGDRNKCIVAFVAEKQEMPYFFYDNRGNWFCADGKKADT